MSGPVLKVAFQASVDGRTRLLILGSLPGERSLAARQYYANPTNQFWRLVGGLIGSELIALDYRERMTRLLAAGVGLWDVIESAQRSGSLDGGIRNYIPNRLGDFVRTLPALRAIAFNGAKAAAIGRRQLGGATAVALVTLPSSSAAYCAMSFAAKLQRWTALRSHIGSPAA